MVAVQQGFRGWLWRCKGKDRKRFPSVGVPMLVVVIIVLVATVGTSHDPLWWSTG